MCVCVHVYRCVYVCTCACNVMQYMYVRVSLCASAEHVCMIMPYWARMYDLAA